MVDVAQQVRASDCGSEGHGFDTHHLPKSLGGGMVDTLDLGSNTCKGVRVRVSLKVQNFGDVAD